MKPRRDVIRLIRKGNQGRNQMKKGHAFRFFNGVKKTMAVLVLLCAAHLGLSEVCNQSFATRKAGSSRADVLEIYGGRSNTSIIAAKQGWWALEPIDCLYNYDLSKPLDRAAALDFLDTLQPRLVVMGFPCTPWSRLTEWSYGRARRRELEVWRNREMCHLHFTEQVANRQLQRGDDCVVENPRDSRARERAPLRRLQNIPGTYNVTVDQCVYGLRSVVDGKLLMKPTWFWVTSPELAAALQARGIKGRCICRDPHGRCEGRAAKEAEHYPPALSRAILRGFRDTLRRKDPSRLQKLAFLLGSDHFMYDQFNTNLPGRMNDDDVVMTCQPCGTEDQEVFGLDNPDAGLEGAKKRRRNLLPNPGETPEAGIDVYKEGIRFDIPKSERLMYSTEMLNAVRRLHVNTGHAPNADLARLLRLSGCSPLAIKAAMFLRSSTFFKN